LDLSLKILNPTDSSSIKFWATMDAFEVYLHFSSIRERFHFFIFINSNTSKELLSILMWDKYRKRSILNICTCCSTWFHRFWIMSKSVKCCSYFWILLWYWISYIMLNDKLKFSLKIFVHLLIDLLYHLLNQHTVQFLDNFPEKIIKRNFLNKLPVKPWLFISFFPCLSIPSRLINVRIRLNNVIRYAIYKQKWIK
jgi:hypothetical protein